MEVPTVHAPLQKSSIPPTTVPTTDVQDKVLTSTTQTWKRKKRASSAVVTASGVKGKRKLSSSIAIDVEVYGSGNKKGRQEVVSTQLAMVEAVEQPRPPQ
jgi:hypothetical protein